MSEADQTISRAAPAAAWDETDPLTLPQRARRRWWSVPTAVLGAVIIGAVGFYAGARVEKSDLPSTSAGGASAAGAAARRLAAFGASASASASGRSGVSSSGGAGPAAAGFGAGFAGFGAGDVTAGTVSSVDHGVIYLTDRTGNTVKVTLSSASGVTKSLPVSRRSVHPGDTVIVTGVKNASGTIVAASVNDAGARGSSSGSGSGSGAGSDSGSGSGGASSAVSSLFGGG